MLRLTKELVNRGFDSRQELMDLLMQINLMEAYATLTGKHIEKELAGKLAQLADHLERPSGQNSGEELKESADADVIKALEMAFDVHGTLSDLVKPATPESLEASVPRKGWARVVWPRVTDILIVTTFVAILAFALGASLKPRWPNLEQLAFLGAALLGASFNGLFTAYKYVQERTFDPASGSSYMVRVVLGTVSGLILANIGDLMISRSAGAQSNTALAALGPGTLALVGGYSADAVNLILQRIADTLVTTVRGNADDAVKAKETQVKAESKTAEFTQRQATVVALSDILATVSDESVRDKIRTVMSSVGQGTISDLKLQPAQGNGKPVLNVGAVAPLNQLPVAAVAGAVLPPQTNGALDDGHTPQLQVAAAVNTNGEKSRAQIAATDQLQDPTPANAEKADT